MKNHAFLEKVPSEKILYLVDISSFIFRAFFAIRALSNRKGEPTNAVYGVASMLARLVDDADPKQLVVLYDSKEPSFRKEIYVEYKAHRPEPPDDLVPQFGMIDRLVAKMQIPSFRQGGVEADDLIATLTQYWLKKDSKNRVVIVTGDKDLMQLVNPRVAIWDTMKDKVYEEKDVVEKMGVPPAQICDYLALVGDTSDNIPGVPGIGPKSAVDLLKAYGTIDGIIQAAKDKKISGKKGEVILSHINDAKLSQKLACLKEDVALKDMDGTVKPYQFTVAPELIEYLKELDFNSMVDRWSKKANGGGAGGGVVKPSQFDFVTIQTESAFLDLMKAIQKKGEMGFDVETTSLNPRMAALCGISICVEDERAFYIPMGHKGENLKQLPEEWVLKHLKPILENPKIKKIGQNLKYDFSVMCQFGINGDGIGADTMVASYVIDPSGRHNLDTLCRKYLNYETVTYETICGKGKNQITFDQVTIEVATRYSAEDALCAWRLWKILLPELEKNHLMEVYSKVELPLVPVLVRMECEGVCIDVAWLKKLSKEFQTRIDEIQERIEVFSKGPINLNSPKQLQKLLFEDLALPVQGKTKTGNSTDADVLEALSPLHEVPRLLLEYREIAKLKGTYVDPLPEMLDPKTGKIHGSFHQTVAATGRLSSSDPNLQNIPIRTERGKRIRRAFVASPGQVLLSADYSQIELRILAHLSGDEDLIQSFKNGEDVHRRTASEMFEVAPEDVTDEQRAGAKAINFGLMYGKTPFGLAQELGISRTDAKIMIEKYFKRYAKVKEFLDSLIQDAKDKGYATTWMGRRRPLPELQSKNPAIRSMGERMAMNTPIQGTAAEMMKLAMIDLDDAIRQKGLKSRMIIQVHDELVLDCPKDEVEEVEALVKKVMEGAMKLKVPLTVNSATGQNWAEL